MMRDRLRGAWQALRGYSAAQDARASTWAPSGGSANSEVSSAAQTISRRARDAVRNDPYAARIVDLWAGNAVGAGMLAAAAMPPDTPLAGPALIEGYSSSLWVPPGWTARRDQAGNIIMRRTA